MKDQILRLVWFTAAILFATSARATDRVELKTGEVFTGKLLRKTADEVSIQIASGGILTFKASSVQKVRTPGSDSPDDETQSQESKTGSGEARREPKKDTPAPTKAAPPGSVVVPASTPPTPPASAPEPGAPAEAESETTGLVTDAAHGFALQPPKGFVAWPEGKSATVILAYTDPFTHSTFTLTTFAAPGSVEDIKKKTVQAYSEVFSVFTVLRNEKLMKAGKVVNPEAWLVEMESQYGNLTTRQIQVFAKKDENAFLLTYTAAEEHYSKSKESFEHSIDTFRYLEASPPAR